MAAWRIMGNALNGARPFIRVKRIPGVTTQWSTTETLTSNWSLILPLSISHPQDRLRHLQVIDAACARLADLFRRRSCLTKKSQLYEICHGSTSPIQFVFIIHQGAAPPLIVTNHMITSNHICTNNWRTTKTHNILCKLKTLTPN
jgi:hypothetical protein